MDFNVTGYEKGINMISDSSLQPAFEKPPLVHFGLYKKIIFDITNDFKAQRIIYIEYTLF